MKVVFIDGTPGFSPVRKDGKATGGILSSLTILPKLLAAKGHEVLVKSIHNTNEKIDGVQYLTLVDEVTTADIVVFNRNVISKEVVAQAHAAGAKVIWWLHDVVDHRYLIDDAFNDVDGIVALSQYCRRTYSSYFGIHPNKFAVIPNGVDKSVFYPGDYSKRNPHLMIYASAPIKGMKPLGFLASNFKRLDPQGEVRMYASQSLHDKNDDALIRFQFDQLKQQGVHIVAPIPQDQLAEVMREAWLLLMPNSYPEICSNLLLQARASGLPVITSPIGSAHEFLRTNDHGIITKSNPCDLYYWWKEFAEAALLLTQDKERHKRYSESCPIGVDSWETIAAQWEMYMSSLLREKVDGNVSVQ